MKFIKRLVLVLFVLFILAFVGAMVAASRIHAEVLSSDLPQDVYESDGDLEALALIKLVRIFNPLSTEDDYTLFEEFLNLMILSVIHSELNASYDPLSENMDNATQYIYYNDYIMIDKLYAKVTEEDQIEVVVAFENHTIFNIDSKISLFFDVEISTLPTPQVVLSLDKTYLSDIEITKDTLDWILSYFDKTSIEDSVPFGELDLTEYTYTVSPTL
ncbi:MAG: hypothetical protein PHP32_06920 [Candidatus Izemoplasmatales bacterium]|nr:hypothetical protein [Candidatus Izemoplasmatales bacterium]